MRRLVLLVVCVLGLGACNDDGDGDASTTTTSAESSTTTSTTEAQVEPVPPLGDVAVTLTPVADVESAVAMAVRPDDPALYVAEQTGSVVAVRGEDVLPVLDLTASVFAGGERGLLGLTFSPDGSLLYVHYSDLDGDTQVDEYAFADGRADPQTRRSILQVGQPFGNHNGGQLTYGPDGFLWLALGDGGSAGDPEDNAQSLDTLLGALLRIDPTSGDPYGIPEDNPFAEGEGRPEIWAYGLRNPWRFTFDRETGDLWIGDVGQNAWEEVNLAPAPERGRGANFGWPFREGTNDFRGGGPDDLVGPVHEYPNPANGCSVTGGYVYRGDAIPELRGAYLFSDYCVSTIRAIRVDGGAVIDEAILFDGASNVAAFGEGPDGELYVLSQSDGLLRIDPA